MQVKSVAGLVPLGNPYIRQRRPAKALPQATEEHAHVGPCLARIVTPDTGIRQRPQPVQPIRRAVPPQPGPGPPSRFLGRSGRISSRTPAATTRTNQGRAEAPAPLARLGIHIQQPLSRNLTDQTAHRVNTHAFHVTHSEDRTAATADPRRARDTYNGGERSQTRTARNPVSCRGGPHVS